MKEVKRILDQLKRAHEGEAWHGPSVMEALANVNAEKALAHPIPAAHSIWEITQHIAAWQHYVVKRLEGQPFEATPEQDWPPITSSSEDGWRNTLKKLEDGHQKLAASISRLKDAALDEQIVPGKPYNLYYMIHGVIQHNLFHAGQISMLKRA